MLFLKFSWFLGFIVLSLFLFSPGFFVIFHNTVMIYNSRNRSNNSTESQKEEKTCFNVRGKWNLNVQCMLTNLKGVYSWNKMWPLTSLVILKCESGTTLHAAQYKWQPGSVLMFCPYYFRNSSRRHFVLMFCGTASLALFMACS